MSAWVNPNGSMLWKGASVISLVAILYSVTSFLRSRQFFPPSVNTANNNTSNNKSNSFWALEETFDGNPSHPSQKLLPSNFDYVVTHRTHPGEQFTRAYKPFLADHDDNCAGPNPNVYPLPQHWVTTRQNSSSSRPDKSFYICKNHLMSSMGDVDGYSVSAFWPRQEFQFDSTNNESRILEFDVNINPHGARSWWEIMIVPRHQLHVAAAQPFLPVSETYPRERIVLDFLQNRRGIFVGSKQIAPNGWIVQERQWWEWSYNFPRDPALSDGRIRRTMRITFFNSSSIEWGIETVDGTFDNYTVDIPGGFPFSSGLVLFKTHAYTPEKDGNNQTYTFHWDNIRFSGPIEGVYDVLEANDVVYLQGGGNRPIGDTSHVFIEIPANTSLQNPVLFGQVHSAMTGQVLLSINGSPNRTVAPNDYERSGCNSMHWQSFRIELAASDLILGKKNSFTWTIGPRPNCLEGWEWDGFSVKFLQIQFDRLDA